MRSFLLPAALAACLLAESPAAQTIHVISRDRVPIARATIAILPNGPTLITDSSGTSSLPVDLGAGDDSLLPMRVQISSVGFLPKQFPLAALPDTILLEPIIYEQDGVVITANRASRERSPIAFSNVTGEQLRRSHTVGDIPLLLQSTPNLYSYTDAGGNLGYTYTQIRGFDDKRIASYVNGVPLNDPEDQFSYWVDLPDFADGVTDIQVQRGVGNSMYGDASFGGSINVVSLTLPKERSARVSTGFGQYREDGRTIGNFERQTVSFATGMLDHHFALSGRFSTQRSDGYRENSWAKSYGYQLGIARIDPGMTTELLLFGGPQQLHLAFFGISKDQIAQNRRFNPLTYENETDNFSQPHYQLHNTWYLSPHTTLTTTLYYIRGSGHFNQLVTGASYADFNIDSASTGGALSGDLVRKQQVDKYQVGWNPKLEIRHPRGTHTLGGSLYTFRSEHEGEVSWAQQLTGGLPPDHRYYFYTGEKLVASIFAQENLSLTGKLNVQATLQLRSQRYEFSQQKIGAFAGWEYTLNWLHLSPRLGLVYALRSESQHAQSIYLNAAMASRTPTDAAIYDATTPGAFPSLRIDQLSVTESGDTAIAFGESTTRAESVLNLELGTTVQTSTLAGSLNLYWMDLRDEIIPYGGINPSNGLAATTNARGSYRIGIEADARWLLTRSWSVHASAAVNRYRIKEFTDTLDVFDDSFTPIDQTVVTYTDKVGPGFPELLGSFELTYLNGSLQGSVRVRGAGKQYLELVNIDSLSIDAHATTTLSASLSLGRIPSVGVVQVTATVDNLFDQEIIRGGYGWNYAYAPSVGSPVSLLGGAEYYVAPKRSFYLQASLDLL